MLTQRAKVDGFYTARTGTIPVLPWHTFAPPFSEVALEAAYDGLVVEF